jgi:hypothetical protein
MKSPNATNKTITITAAPAPIPAFAPVDSWPDEEATGEFDEDGYMVVVPGLPPVASVIVFAAGVLAPASEFVDANTVTVVLSLGSDMTERNE